MEENQFQKNRLARLLTIGLISGIIAAGLNIIYMYLYESFTGFSMPDIINAGSVAISSIIPGVFAGLLYFMLRNFTANNKAFYFFGLILLLVALISLIGPLSDTLPDGTKTPDQFAGLAIPMHFIAPFIYFIMLVRSVPRK